MNQTLTQAQIALSVADVAHDAVEEQAPKLDLLEDATIPVQCDDPPVQGTDRPGPPDWFFEWLRDDTGRSIFEFMPEQK